MKVTLGGRPPWRGRRPAGLAWALWGLALASLVAAAWLDHLLRQAGRPDLVVIEPTAIPVPAVHMGVATVGAVVASRRPRHPVGWLLLAIGLIPDASMPAVAYANYGLAARPGVLPAARWIALYLPAVPVMALLLLGVVLLLTPAGSLPMGGGWRCWARGTTAALAGLLLAVAFAPDPITRPYRAGTNPFDLRGLQGPVPAVYRAGVALAVAVVVVGAASLLLRFRRARGVERQQLRWVALAAVVVALLVVAVAAGESTGGPPLPVLDPALAGVLSLAVLEVGIGAAVLRYRLYDLDRIISRTIAYGLLTVLLGGGYAVVVLGLGQLVGRSSSLVVAVATLAVAAVFQPARRRVQELVDRRFNRRRYDAAKTIEGFSARLRQQVDLDSLTAEVLAVVDQTMQPTRVSLWLRPLTARREAVPMAFRAITTYGSRTEVDRRVGDLQPPRWQNRAGHTSE
jgi:hypothetical protein